MQKLKISPLRSMGIVGLLKVSESIMPQIGSLQGKTGIMLLNDKTHTMLLWFMMVNTVLWCLQVAQVAQVSSHRTLCPILSPISREAARTRTSTSRSRSFSFRSFSTSEAYSRRQDAGNTNYTNLWLTFLDFAENEVQTLSRGPPDLGQQMVPLRCTALRCFALRSCRHWASF